MRVHNCLLCASSQISIIFDFSRHWKWMYDLPVHETGCSEGLPLLPASLSYAPLCRGVLSLTRGSQIASVRSFLKSCRISHPRAFSFFLALLVSSSSHCVVLVDRGIRVFWECCTLVPHPFLFTRFTLCVPWLPKRIIVCHLASTAPSSFLCQRVHVREHWNHFPLFSFF